MKKLILMLIVVVLSSVSMAQMVKDSKVSIRPKEELISYQGKILKDGEELENKEYQVVFRLYSSEENGEMLWEEKQNLQIANGLINANLGKVNPFNPEIFAGNLYLELEVNGEISKRQILTGSPYSIYAKRVAGDALVAGEGIEIKKLESGKLEILSNDNNLRKKENYVFAGDITFLTGEQKLHWGRNSSQRRSFLAPRNESDNDWDWNREFGYNNQKQVWYFDNNLSIGYTNGEFSHSKLAVNGGISFLEGKEELCWGSTAAYHHSFLTPRNIQNTDWDYSKEFGYNTQKAVWYFDDKVSIGIGDGSVFANDAKLSVYGKVVAKEIEVRLSGWADYVFEDDYKLRSLREVEDFIKANGHLPGIKSASEIESQGLDLGETQKIMMEKIEELTLYMIELKKENEALKKQLNQINQ